MTIGVTCNASHPDFGACTVNKKIFIVGISSLLLVGLAILINLLFIQPASFRGAVYESPYPVAPNFRLTGANGKPFILNANKEKIILLFFGYTYCPDVCPTTLSEMKLTMDKLGGNAEKVQVVFISVDPGRDTSVEMQKYVERFNAAFIGLSGTEEELEPVWNDYGIFREVVPGTSATNYIINHTARVFLVDTHGNLRLSFGFQTPPEDIAHDIEIILNE